MLNIFLEYIAGFVSIISPCVLPLLPIIIVSSLNTHKKGPILLAMGLVMSFTATGLFVATIGLSLGLDQFILQKISATILIIFGLIMLSSSLYQKFSSATSNKMSTFNSKISMMNFDSLKGQFTLGLLLGLVWTPCVGPTLGSAISLATQGQDVTYAGFVMFSFALGVVTPVVLMSLLSQSAMHKVKNAAMKKSDIIKKVLGLLFIVLGLLLLTDTMSVIENFVINNLFTDDFIDFIYKY